MRFEMRLITACNAGWFGKILPYLDSLKQNADFPATLISVGFEGAYPGVDCALLTRVQNAGSPLETESPQHGSFLQVLPGNDDELLIFTDGDIVLQRPLTIQEHAWLGRIPFGFVSCGWNSGPAETLEVEANRLFPRVTMEQLAGRLGSIARTASCYNIGVFATHRQTYRRIYEAYMPLWKIATDAFQHPARQQWLVNYVIATLNIPVIHMEYSFHANGHYGIPPGVELVNGAALYQGEVVAFKHRL